MSELMSSFHLTTYPIVALALFLLAFVGICTLVLRRSSGAELSRAATMALDEGDTPAAPLAGTPAAAPSSTPAQKSCSGKCSGCCGSKKPGSSHHH